MQQAAAALTFTSPIQTPYPENNVVRAAFFPARRDNGRAVLVLPQWNADEQSHLGLCKLLNRFGITALRMNLAYHGPRMPPELQRADYHVSSNLGRTIHAGRQSVVDARACLDWLRQQGYGRLGILGTSLGSCIAFITAAHDQRISTGVFNHVSMYFSDVIWTGLSTEHIRKGLVGQVTQDQLREYWSVDQPRILPRPAARPGFEKPADLGAPRFHFLARVFPAGAGVLSQPPASAPSLHLALRALHYRAVSLQPARRHGNVPVLKPQLVGASTAQAPTRGVPQENI